MIKQEELLWKLQELKQEETSLIQTEEIITVVRNLKDLKSNVKIGEQELQSLTEMIKNTEDEVEELEKESNSRTEQLKTQKEKLYDAKGGSLKELLSLQQAILKLETQGKDTENKYWSLLKKIDDYKQKKIEYKKTIRACQLEFNKVLGKYKKLKSQVELKLAEIKSKQEAVREQLLPEVNRLYLEAEKRFPVSFVAKLHKESCTGCHIGVSTNLVRRVKEGKTIQHCDNCGRILINYKN